MFLERSKKTLLALRVSRTGCFGFFSGQKVVLVELDRTISVSLIGIRAAASSGAGATAERVTRVGLVVAIKDGIVNVVECKRRAKKACEKAKERSFNFRKVKSSPSNGEITHINHQFDVHRDLSLKKT